jgi:hypothetical protein
LRTRAVAKAAVASGEVAPVLEPESRSELAAEIVIDFVDPDPLDKPSEEAKALYDQDLLEVVIAATMKRSKSMITKLLHHWFNSRGQTLPDGRTRRSRLKKKHVEPPDFQQLVVKVMELYEQEIELGDIAQAVGYDRNTITKVVKFYHESRGLPVPDGRTRRKTLPRTGKKALKSVRNDETAQAHRPVDEPTPE